MFLVLLFVIAVFSIKTDGVWSLTYWNKDCSGNKMIATRLTPVCVPYEKTQSSWHYTCSNTLPTNVTVDVYHTDDCEKEGQPPISSIHLGNSGVCNNGQMYKCLPDYKLNYPHLHLYIPMNVSNPQIGGPTNPIVGENFVPMIKCESIPSVPNKFWTVECDPKTKEAKVAVYDHEMCVIPKHKLEMKPGQVYDFEKLVESPTMPHIYQEYVGCDP